MLFSQREVKSTLGNHYYRDNAGVTKCVHNLKGNQKRRASSILDPATLTVPVKDRKPSAEEKELRSRRKLMKLGLLPPEPEVLIPKMDPSTSASEKTPFSPHPPVVAIQPRSRTENLPRKEHTPAPATTRCLRWTKFAFVNGLKKLYVHIAHMIGCNPWKYIMVTLLFTVLCASGLHKVQLSTKIKEGYTPVSARSRQETAIFQEFFSAGGKTPYLASVLLRPQALNGSLIDRQHYKEVYRLEQFLTYELNVTVDGKLYTFADFCARNPMDKSQCAMNMVVPKIKKVIVDDDTDDVILDYPLMSFETDMGSEQMNIASTFFQVKRSTDKTVLESANRLQSCSLIVLYYKAFIAASGVERSAVEAWELALYEWAYYGPGAHNNLLQVMANGDKMIISEMHRGGFSMAKFFIGGFLLMVVFVTSSVVVVTKFHGAFRLQQLFVAAAALLTPMLAFFTTFGLIAWTGTEMYPMMVLAPYLILAIGVDSAFLLVHAWHRLSLPPQTSVEPVRRSAARLARVLEDVGPSITVTSATNALAFGIGATTDTPVIQSFCLATAIAIALCFVYELTLFGSVLVLVGRGDTIHDPITNASITDEKESWPPIADPSPTGLQAKAGQFAHKYAQVISSWPAIVLVLLGCVCLWTWAIWGALSINTLVSIDKILPANSPLIRAYTEFDQVVWKEYYPVNVVVNKAPKLPNDTLLAEFNEMRARFENGTGALGPKYTLLWMDYYKRYTEKMADMFSMFGVADDGDETFNYDGVESFLDNFAMFKDLIHMNKDMSQVTSFQFLSAYAEADNWDTRVDYTLAWRRLADAYPQFNTTVYSPNALNCDAILNLRAITRETVMITLLVMSVICVLFIPSLCGVLCAIVAITSTTIAVMGSLSWWSIDLDPMSVAAVLMAIGFSVDFTAHTSYHYQKAVFDNEPGCETTAGRLTYTFESVAFPMCQAGFSTFLCVFPLAFHGDYAPEVLVKAISVLVVWGLLHGLVILPVFLAALPDCSLVQDERKMSQKPSHASRAEEMKPMNTKTMDDVLEDV